MDAYEIFEFSSPGSIPLYGILQYIMWNVSLIIYNSAGRESTREKNYFNEIMSDFFRQELSATIKIN